ncbi:MAG: hypothetical protein C5B55_11960 [Blastocatellia bacterium]|nr:MAG: hypothetical protein C5B55_11960 [Blastocatellia bacterium]
MTDEQAGSFIKRWLALDGDNTQLRLKFVPEFEKVMSLKKTAIFFQIDRRVGMMIELQLAWQVPLVKPQRLGPSASQCPNLRPPIPYRTHVI